MNLFLWFLGGLLLAGAGAAPRYQDVFQLLPGEVRLVGINSPGGRIELRQLSPGWGNFSLCFYQQGREDLSLNSAGLTIARSFGAAGSQDFSPKYIAVLNCHDKPAVFSLGLDLADVILRASAPHVLERGEKTLPLPSGTSWLRAQVYPLEPASAPLSAAVLREEDYAFYALRGNRTLLRELDQLQGACEEKSKAWIGCSFEALLNPASDYRLLIYAGEEKIPFHFSLERTGTSISFLTWKAIY